jgi:hypothetical protein
MENTVSQNAQIRAHLERGGSLTAIEALAKFGCLRLSGRIYDLRADGLPIRQEMIKVGTKRVAEYSLQEN